MEVPEEFENDLRRSAENLHTILGYSAKDPKKLEGAFLLLTMLMHLADSTILHEEERNKTTAKLQYLEESLTGGAIKISQIEENLQEVIKSAKEQNVKAKIICMLIELEHIAVIHPLSSKHAISYEEFNEKISPLQELLHRDINSIEGKIITKTLEQAKDVILSGKVPTNEALENLYNQCKKILNGGI